MANCTHDCSTCSSDCASRTANFLKKPHRGSKISRTVAVTSGKGGVGKSLATALLAVRARAMGLSVGILDADITGPSIPRMFGADMLATGTDGNIRPVTANCGIKVISMNNLLEHEDDPVVWRGSLIAGAVLQFWTDVVWGDLDLLFIDMPPGTGDVPLSVFQSIPLSGAVIASTPQKLVEMVVKKNVNMANMLHVPLLGLIENMSYFVCPDCGQRHEIFGESIADALAKKYSLPAVSRIPVDPALAELADSGRIFEADTDCVAEVMQEVLKSRKI